MATIPLAILGPVGMGTLADPAIPRAVALPGALRGPGLGADLGQTVPRGCACSWRRPAGDPGRPPCCAICRGWWTRAARCRTPWVACVHSAFPGLPAVGDLVAGTLVVHVPEVTRGPGPSPWVPPLPLPLPPLLVWRSSPGGYRLRGAQLPPQSGPLRGAGGHPGGPHGPAGPGRCRGGAPGHGPAYPGAAMSIRQERFEAENAELWKPWRSGSGHPTGRGTGSRRHRRLCHHLALARERRTRRPP